MGVQAKLAGKEDKFNERIDIILNTNLRDEIDAAKQKVKNHKEATPQDQKFFDVNAFCEGGSSN